ncbi:Uncharacterized conserved protein YecE, DUF72 family [Desulfotomaculum arcticum]|uniref:Uncharacterized conserved protein YecE, DUF72 family n=1 Tax=Desulfotruncus arcticus DSM 17038 TaxID=1121424 RepID=A0A1I2RLS8_9FIRM|nr:DUF72 domain-containing protein [Desulfotruncus arcticus]SFG41410.1 Uncharacterized conserved protein YecE, DUF72 family [Desulfotomaculum arcticum] [Desulfotruncus arcticus DSM 17038]
MILVGTAGYSYDSWIGPVYPKEINKKEMLNFYAKEFSFAEINSSYYRMPNRFMLYHMQAKTQEHFQFVIKAHKSLTHVREDNEKEFTEFKEALKPLVEAQKFGCVLAQFPSSFRYRDENIDYLKEFRNQLGDIPVVVEFRHEEWMDENVFELLEDQDLGYVCVDEPQFKTLVPPVVRATSRVGYVRFHGRNYKKWWQHKETHERYDYLYSEAELKEWVPWIKKLAAKTEKTFISMNNHYRGQAAINGRMLREMLEEEWGEVR